MTYENSINTEIDEACYDIEHSFAPVSYGEIYGIMAIILGIFVYALIHWFH